MTGNAGATAPSPLRRALRWLQPMVGIGLSIIIISFALRIVPVRDVAEAARTADVRFLLLAALATSLNLLLRAWRWRFFFPDRAPAYGKLFSAMTIGMATNGVMPGRAGEALRLVLIRRFTDFRTVFLGSTIVAERIIDALVLLGLVLLATLLGGDTPSNQSVVAFGVRVEVAQIEAIRDGMGTVVLVAIGGLLFLIHPWSKKLILGGIERLGFERLHHLGVTLWEQVDQGFACFRTARRLAVIVAISLAGWGGLVLTNLLVAWGLPGIELGVSDALMFTGVTILAASIPSAPGAWGVFEAGAVLSLMMAGLSIDTTVALAYGALAHLCQYLPVVLIGSGCALFNAVQQRRIEVITPPG